MQLPTSGDSSGINPLGLSPQLLQHIPDNTLKVAGPRSVQKTVFRRVPAEARNENMSVRRLAAKSPIHRAQQMVLAIF